MRIFVAFLQAFSHCKVEIKPIEVRLESFFFFDSQFHCSSGSIIECNDLQMSFIWEGEYDRSLFTM